jgi:serine/threonine protein phosphatase PrpC
MSEQPIPGLPVILFAEVCDRGTMRQENQDSVLHVQIPLGELLIVADGIGGYTGGAVASRKVVENFYTHMSSLPADYSGENAIREAAARANAEIVAAASTPDSPHQQMGSTIVVALLQQYADGSYAWVGHVGDSRAYLVRAGRIYRLTTDHSAVQSLLNRNLITPEEAERHPDTSVLTRCLGHQPEVEIDIEKHPLAVGDTLLLCSDGLWGFVLEKEILAAVENPSLTVEAAAHSLLELALAAGGHDNIGIEMARLIPPPDIPPRHQQVNPALIWVLGVFLLSLVGLFVLAYLTFWAQ